MIAGDALRTPSGIDPDAARYKDWLHLNVLDHASGTIGLVNASLHGAPGDPRSRAVGTGLFLVPGSGWIGNVEVRGIDEVNLGPGSIALEHVAVAVDRDRREVLASAQFPDEGLRVDLRAYPASPDLDVERRVPLGPGWISWAVVPVVRLEGRITAGPLEIDASRASGYHDHNWGRWHWGDDIGWEWGCFLPAGDGPTFVIGRTTDREHRRGSEPSLIATSGRRHRAFGGPRVEIMTAGLLEATPRRLPGAMAALHQDRARPRLPERVTVRAADGRDRVEIEFTARAAAQLIAGDPAGHGFGFVHELVGEYRYAFELDRSTGEGGGLAVVEYVD